MQSWGTRLTPGKGAGVFIHPCPSETGQKLLRGCGEAQKNNSQIPLDWLFLDSPRVAFWWDAGTGHLKSGWCAQNSLKETPGVWLSVTNDCSSFRCSCMYMAESWATLEFWREKGSINLFPVCNPSMMLKLKLQYFGHLMRGANSLEKTLMLGKIEGRRRGQQRMRWLDGITDSMDVSLSNSRSWWWTGAADHGIAKSWTQLSNWKTSTILKNVSP